jgi:excinuclease UvrABC ATPase subunit
MVKIQCHTCLEKGWIHETEYETLKDVAIVCPECDGHGYIEHLEYTKKEEEG